MEKIYVDEKQRKNGKWNAFNISLGLTFAVAFIAMVSILFVGLSGQSYALDDVTTLPVNIKTQAEIQYTLDSTPANTHAVQMYTATNADAPSEPAFPVFCLESDAQYATDTNLSRSETEDLDDAGYLYLFSKLEKLSVSEGEDVKYWIEQQAIWSYIGLINPDDETVSSEFKNNGSGDSTFYSAARQVTVLTRNPWAGASGTSATYNAPNGKTFFSEYNIPAIISEAVNIHNSGVAPLSLTLNKASGDFTLYDNDKSLRSPKLTIVASPGVEDFAEVKDEYALALQGAPEGSYILGITSDGKTNKLSEDALKNMKMSEYKEFYVVVPKDKITEANKKFTVSITGKFEVYSGYYYRADGAQSVTTLKKVVTNHEAGTPLEVVYTPDVPDTVMNASQGMYLIGLIVLLTGLGILYVNVKKQQQN